jgi:DNA-binding NarL/FixJ family response regulator
MATKRHVWTERDLDFLRQHAPTQSDKWIAKMLGRSWRTVQTYRLKMGVKRHMSNVRILNRIDAIRAFQKGDITKRPPVA